LSTAAVVCIVVLCAAAGALCPELTAPVSCAITQTVEPQKTPTAKAIKVVLEVVFIACLLIPYT
jgi:hypothetical protein